MDYFILICIFIVGVLIADNARLRKEIKEKINFEYEQFKVNRKY
jgi:hypothetical protein